MIRKTWVHGFGIAMFASSAVCFGSGIPPIFTSQSPDSVYVDLNAGQTSFECFGTAIDFDAGDTIHFITDAPVFMQLEYEAGNPASYRLHAENLTGTQYGGYIVYVVALDYPSPVGNAARFAISIGPEPASAASLFFGFVVIRRRR